MPQPPGPLFALERLVCKAVAGDRDAFAELYGRYVTRVYRYVYYLTGGAPDVEDLTAQTFLQAWQKIGCFRPRGPSFGPWLLRIAHNLAISYLRNGHKQQATLPPEYPDDREGADPTRWVQEEGEAARVRRAILALTPVEREVIILRFVDGLGYAETAETLGRKVNAIRVAQWRALTHLRAILETLPEQPETLRSTRSPR